MRINNNKKIIVIGLLSPHLYKCLMSKWRLNANYIYFIKDISPRFPLRTNGF